MNLPEQTRQALTKASDALHVAVVFADAAKAPTVAGQCRAAHIACLQAILADLESDSAQVEKTAEEADKLSGFDKTEPHNPQYP